MAEKSINDLQREKLEWEIRALKRQARPGGWFTWILVLLVFGLGAALAFQQPWLGLQAKDEAGEETPDMENRSASARVLQLERELSASERELNGAKKQVADLLYRENQLSEEVSMLFKQNEATKEYAEDQAQKLVDCRALNDEAFERRAQLLEKLNEIDALWDALPEKLTFAQLRELQGIEDQLKEIRRILEDSGTQAD